MGKHGVGATFCLIAALLFCTRYIAAATFMSSIGSWDSGLFAAGLAYVGTPLLALSILSFLIGVAYLVWAEIAKNKSGD